MKQIAVALLLLTTILLMVQPVAAGQGSPDVPVTLRITTSSSWGNPGDRVTVSGSGAVPGRTVFVTLSPQADSAVGAFITEEVTPAANGTFSMELTIPGDVSDGIYAVRAEQFGAAGGVLQYYWTAFTVGAGGKGLALPASGGVVKGGSSRVSLILGLGMLVIMVSKGMSAVGKG
jgi:hypothetical protein